MGRIGPVFIDGQQVAERDAVIPVSDAGFQRGFGVFEAMRVYGEHLFRLDAHLDRLERSAAQTGIELPDRNMLVTCCNELAPVADVVRIHVSAGDDPLVTGGSRSIVTGETMPELAPSVRLQSRVAPWHSDGVEYELTGAKTFSYAPNFAARLRAQQAGFDDALLIGRNGRVLEGPTYSIGWVLDGIVETPGIDLGILQSITRDVALEVAAEIEVTVVEVHEPLERLLAADEVFVLSTGREVTPAVGVDDTVFSAGPVTKQLAEGFTALVERECAA